MYACSEATENTKFQCIGTLLLQKLNSICKEARGYEIDKLAKKFGETMEPLYIKGIKASVEISAVHTEPSRCSIKIKISKRILVIQENVHQNRKEV
ncbi:hypothetical protein AYI69_g4649 [Smittium culicis]|uniref:Uncharacterized protein n=1 Tax=Smittium culicis TaxID=133412 RepID=A0A1R1YBX7_9FUNG|nr:hypothetical protein AYI69_g4649 [Smittium culicis]